MNGEERTKKLIELVESTGQYEMNKISIKTWLSMGENARMIGITLPMRRVKCPSCGMSGASFQACDLCGGPACDNCLNMAKGLPICKVCNNK